jgi:hypothetical protein
MGEMSTISEVIIGVLCVPWTQNCLSLWILIFSEGDLALLMTAINEY